MTAAALKAYDNRRAPRDIVSVRVPMVGADGVSGRVLLVDLSPFGFMARGVVAPAVGDAVTLRLPAVGKRGATIRWSLGGRMGGEFDEPLSPHAYVHLLAAAPHDRPRWNEV